jgi:hypothetical protein
VKQRAPAESASARQRRIVQRTAQLPATSRVLYRIEHYTSFPSVSGVTLVMVFAIQHTQGREQAPTQRKLDELLRSFPGADASLMLLEEAPPEVLLDVEEEQREVQPPAPDTDAD